MEIDISFPEQTQILFVVARGRFDPVAAREALVSVRKQASQTGATRILIDAFELSAPATEFARYLTGVAIAELFPYPFRVAVLYDGELINKFAENTAVNRGASVFVCSDRELSVRWLLEGRTSGALESDGERSLIEMGSEQEIR